MTRKIILLISSFICSGLLNNEGRCSGMMSKKFLESLHQKSIIVQRKVVDVDWKGSKIILQDKFEDKTDSNSKRLDRKDLEELKKKSFIPPRRNVIKIDPNEDIIYYEKREK